MKSLCHRAALGRSRQVGFEALRKFAPAQGAVLQRLDPHARSRPRLSRAGVSARGSEKIRNDAMRGLPERRADRGGRKGSGAAGSEVSSLPTNYAATFFGGRPPSLPFSRAALVFAGDFTRPPILPPFRPSIAAAELSADIVVPFATSILQKLTTQVAFGYSLSP